MKPELSASTGKLQDLEREETRLRLVVESVQDYAIFMLDPQGRVATWNPGAERIMGYRAEEIIGQHFSRFFPAEDVLQGKAGRELENARASGRVEDEGLRVRKDGAQFVASVVLTAIRSESRELLGFAKVTRDLTDQRKREENFRLLVEGVKDYAIYRLGTDGKITSWNEGAHRLKGYSADEVQGQSYARFFTPADAARGEPERQLQIAAETGRFEGQGWRVRKDGVWFWAEVSMSALYDDAGGLRGFAKVTHDTSERRRLTFLGDASALLGASLDYPATLSQVARLTVPFLADWCSVHIRQGEQLEALAFAHVDSSKVPLGWELIRQFPPQPVHAQGLWEVVRTGKPELMQEVPEAFLQLRAPEADQRRSLRELGMRSAMFVPLVARGQVLGAMTFATGESGRRYTDKDLDLAQGLAERCARSIENARAHQSLEAEREFLAAVVQQMSAGVIIAEAPSGRTVLANREAERLRGLPQPEVGAAPRDLPMSRALRLGEAVAAEDRVQSPEGELIISSNTAPVRNKVGQIIGAVALLQDVTAQRQAQAEAQREAEFRERFIGILSHDLRNPLAAIHMAGQLLQMGGIPEEKQRKAAGRIVAGAARMGRMIGELLDLTRSRLGKGIPIAPRSMDLVEVCRQVVAELQVAHPKCDLHLQLPPRLSGEWDFDRMAQVISNLAGNAVQYGGDAGPVEVVLSEEGPEALLEIHNWGNPISDELQPILFDPFRRGAHAPSYLTPQSGLGLGLFITRQIVLAHGGSIQVRSTREEGTAFRVRLPRATQAQL